MPGWTWTRATGQTEELPDGFEFMIEPFDVGVPYVAAESRPGAFVDAYRLRPKERSVRLEGKLQAASLIDVRDKFAHYSWLFGGGVGKLFARGQSDRYLRATLLSLRDMGLPSGLVREYEGLFLLHVPFWLAASSSVVQWSTTAAAGVTQQVTNGGKWRVAPKIELSVSGASVTNPKLRNENDGREVRYTGTLAAGQTLTLDPDALTAMVGGTNVLDKINLEWFDPSDRFYLEVGIQNILLAAGSIDIGGTLTAKLTWYNGWP